jgi:hypothetical protein
MSKSSGAVSPFFAWLPAALARNIHCGVLPLIFHPRLQCKGLGSFEKCMLPSLGVFNPHPFSIRLPLLFSVTLFCVIHPSDQYQVQYVQRLIWTP